MGMRFNQENRVQQHFGPSCDVNEMRKRMSRGQTVKVVPSDGMFYGDFTRCNDFQSAQNAICAAREAFDALDYRIRDRFNNDPNQFLRFVQDEKNREEAIELGLLQKKRKKYRK